jgi:hypothetical protein
VTTVADVDRLVVASDGAIAHYWPRLGPKVRTAYVEDRNKWIAIRSAPDGGAASAPSVLETQRRVFGGWLRAFKAVAAHRAARKAPALPRPTTPAAPSAPPVTANNTPPTVPPALAAASRGASGAGAAVAGGLVLASLIAFAARRRRA